MLLHGFDGLDIPLRQQTNINVPRIHLFVFYEIEQEGFPRHLFLVKEEVEDLLLHGGRKIANTI